jgi:predicted RNA-binding Zn-ribbon protein involved in translation (DUF1610 family)
MLKRLLPKDLILRRALNGFVAFFILSLIASALGGWEAYRSGWLARDREDVAEIAWQFGIGSPEAAAAIRHVGESPSRKELVALLDPATGKAVAAWPADLAGKAPEEMTLSNGARLPSLRMMQGRERFTLRRSSGGRTGALWHNYREKVTVCLDALSPWGKESRSEFDEPHRVASPPSPDTSEPDAESARKEGEEFKFNRGGHGFRDRSRFPSIALPIGYLLVVSASQPFTVLAVAASLIGGAGAVGLLVYWLSIAWWVFLDARQRGSRAFAWGVLALLTNLVGVAVYLVARREWRQCPSCSANVEKAFRHCPSCGHALELTCAKCGRAMRRDWAFCVACAAPRRDAQSGR